MVYYRTFKCYVCCALVYTIRAMLISPSPSSPFDFDFQSQIRSIKRNMELVEDIPSQYDVGNLGGDNFDSIDRHLMESEVDPIGAGSDGDIHPVRQCDLTILEQ